MNWNVAGVLGKITQKEIDRADEVCAHIVVGGPAFMCGEQDSFGPVTRFYFCKECHEKNLEAESEETRFCHDCGQEVKVGKSKLWRWYDFYAPQGDEPLCICDDCWGKDKHQSRMARDKVDCDVEMKSLCHLDDDYEDDDYDYGDELPHDETDFVEDEQD